MTTKTPDARSPAGHDPSQLPVFAVTVDVVKAHRSVGTRRSDGTLNGGPR